MRLMAYFLTLLVLLLAVPACYIAQEPNREPAPAWGAGGSGGSEDGEGGDGTGEGSSGGESATGGSGGQGGASATTGNGAGGYEPMLCGGVPSVVPDACWLKGEEVCCLPENFPGECAKNGQDDSGAMCGCCL